MDGWLRCDRNSIFSKSILFSESDVNSLSTTIGIKPLRERDIDIVYCGGPNNDNYHQKYKNAPLAIDCLKAIKSIKCLDSTKMYKTFFVGKTNDENITDNCEYMKNGDWLSLLGNCKILLVSAIYDASPRIITDALSRGCAVIINEQIFGGWKYVVPETGEYFTDVDTCILAFNKIIDKIHNDIDFNPSVWYYKYFGREKSAERLGTFVNIIKQSKQEESNQEESKPRIYIIIPYYGSFPNYFQLYLNSAKINQDILTVFLISDIDISSYNLPPNVIYINMSIDNLRKKISNFLFEEFNETIEYSKLIANYYKLTDFKTMYPKLFVDILRKYKLTTDDYVGWGDIDLIYGKISSFINFNQKDQKYENYDIIGGRWGHFTVLRNIDSLKNIYKDIPDFYIKCIDNSRMFSLDEHGGFERLLQKYKVFDTTFIICDIIPDVWISDYRKDHANYTRHFFNAICLKKNIKHVHYNNEYLETIYEDDTSYKNLYCHFQKRKFNIVLNNLNDFFITENTFQNN
jgi:hypothetical protein